MKFQTTQLGSQIIAIHILLNISRIKDNQTVNSLLKFLGEPRGKPDTNIAQHEQHKKEFSMRYFSLLKKYELHFQKS